MSAAPPTVRAAAAPAGWIGFGSVRHRRARPRVNAFAYRSYFLRLPVRTLEEALAGQPLIAHNRWHILSFYDRDHGARGAMSLVQWIDGVLGDAGIADATGEVWLHTLPRVLGYVFNPVSFWFCHRPDGQLRAVLCEVNNTFGERHSYLLYHGDGRALRYGEELSAAKAFHVSPFCAVEGAYRFRFMIGAERSVCRIDYDDARGPLLKTSLAGRLEPLCSRSLLKALAAYPLMTFGVVARIHWQALRLFVKRVPFFSKPALPAVEVTR